MPLLDPSECALQGFGFKAYKPGSLQHSNVCWCDGSNEPAYEELSPIPESTRVLFIAGAQKAGTTWLFNALETHPTFVGASHAYKCDAKLLAPAAAVCLRVSVAACYHRQVQGAATLVQAGAGALEQGAPLF